MGINLTNWGIAVHDKAISECRLTLRLLLLLVGLLAAGLHRHGAGVEQGLGGRGQSPQDVCFHGRRPCRPQGEIGYNVPSRWGRAVGRG